MLHLRGHVARVFPELDADEIVQEVIVRLIERRQNVAPSKIENPSGYLLAMTRNAAIDAIRAGSRRRQPQLDHPSDQFSSEDEIAGLIDRDATHAALLAALRIHIHAGDTLVVPIVTAWLDTAEELGHAPSTREVAARAGVSHTSVAQALVRFRATLVGPRG
jgi:RNA polymerase sigma factor (sigma-70 family)